jgi:hypothetical protein
MMDAPLAEMAESGENDASALHPSRTPDGSNPPRPIKRCGLGIDFPGTHHSMTSSLMMRALLLTRCALILLFQNTHTHQQTMPKRTLQLTKACGSVCLVAPKKLLIKKLQPFRAPPVQVLLPPSHFLRRPCCRRKQSPRVAKISLCK